MTRTVTPSTFCEQLRRSGVDEDDIPRLLHDLSIRQHAECSTIDGELLHLRVDPAKATFYIELVLDTDE